MTDWDDVYPPVYYVPAEDELKEGDHVWAIDDGSSGVVDEMDYQYDIATVCWDRTGCCGDIPVAKLRRTEK